MFFLLYYCWKKVGYNDEFTLMNEQRKDLKIYFLKDILLKVKLLLIF